MEAQPLPVSDDGLEVIELGADALPVEEVHMALDGPDGRVICPVLGDELVKRALDAVGSNAVGTCNCQYRLLPRPDGTCRIADGLCGFVPRPVPALALSRTFRGAREKRRSGTVAFTPPNNCDRKRNR